MNNLQILYKMKIYKFNIIAFLIFLFISCQGGLEKKQHNQAPTKVQPQGYFIDALDPGSWSGLVFVNPKKQAVAFRFGTYEMNNGDMIYIAGKELDNKVSYFNNGDSLYHNVTKVGLKSPSGKYAHLEWKCGNSIWDLQWGKKNNITAIGRIQSKNNTNKNQKGIVVECYFPWNYNGEFKYEKGEIRSENPKFQLKLSKTPDFIFASKDSLLRHDTLKDIIKNQEKTEYTGKFLYLVYDSCPSLKFLASIDNNLQNMAFANVDEYLHISRQKAKKNRPEITGKHPDIIPAICDNINWMKLYIPHTEHAYIPAGRTWDWGGWALFEWDAFFNSIILSVNNHDFAYENLLPIYNVLQEPNGNIPNYKCGDSKSWDHSQPSVGSFIVWKLYRKTGNIKVLEDSYKPLKKWHFWWREKVETGFPRRDGNGDGLMEWGADNPDSVPDFKPTVKTCMFESRDDSPIFDSCKYMPGRWTMDMNALDQNCFQALDAEHMALIADKLGFDEDAKYFRKEYKRIKNLVNEKMWDPKTGFYYDLYWSGKFNYQKAPANFYPLLAGIAPQDRAEKMMEKLLDTSIYWGKYVIPSISRDNPAFSDQQYWRGSIWPPPNYLVYQGLKRYRYDSIAAEFAQKSMKMFIDNYRKNGGACNENFDSRTGKGHGQKYQSWGLLFALIYLEEFIDYEPGGGLRIGSLGQYGDTLKNICINEDFYDIFCGNKTTAWKNGEKLFEASVPVTVRINPNYNEGFLEVNAKENGLLHHFPLQKHYTLVKGINKLTK